jgi:hypothetical protein
MNAKMKTRFDGLDLSEAQQLYRESIMAAHPDRGGDEEEAKTINSEWATFTARVVNDAFARADGKTGDFSATPFAEILRTIVKFNIKIEIIGFWIYAFQSYEYREQLKNLGFWFSAKHHAWIFSGGKKRNIRHTHTTERNREVWGSQTVENEYEEKLAIV